MLVIRPEQFRLIKLGYHKENLQPFLDHVTEYHPERAAEIGADALRDLLGSAIGRALEYGLAETPDLYSFIDLVMIFGLDWSGKDLRWMQDRMMDASKGDPPQRLADLRREVVRKLAQSEAPSNDDETESS